MLVQKIYLRPADQQSEDRALGELQLYQSTRDELARIANKWMRIGSAEIVPEYQEIAQQYRANPPATGRRPTLRTTVLCKGRRIKVRDDDPLRAEKLLSAANKTKTKHLTQTKGIDGALEKLRQRWGLVAIVDRDGQRYRVRCSKSVSGRPPIEKWVKASESLETKLSDLRDLWESVEVLNRDQGRNDHQELQAADLRAAYRRHVDAGGYHATFHLASEAVTSAAKTTEARDSFGRPLVKRLRESETSDDGRAAIDLARLQWDPNDPFTVTIHGTRWTAQHRQLMQRPRTLEQEDLGREHKRLDPRRPPIDAKIVRAHLQRDRMSPASRPNVRWSWYLVLTLDCDHSERKVKKARVEAGLDLCWRQTKDGLSYRVAYLADANGQEREITVPREVVSALEHYDAIQSTADTEADRLRAMLGMNDRTSHRTLVQRAVERHGLADSSYRHRDRSTWTAAELAHHMVHLDEYAYHGRHNALVQRDQHYLREIRSLLQECCVVYCEDLGGEPAMVTKAGGAKARDQRQRTAPFRFLTLLKNEAPNFGARIELRDPAYTSRICDMCDHDMGPSSQLWRWCQECGTGHDVDALAARNLLRGSNGPGKSEPPDPLADRQSARNDDAIVTSRGENLRSNRETTPAGDRPLANRNVSA